MKSGPTPWTANCPQPVLARINEALDARDQSPRAIYDALNLTRFCRFHTFRRYVTQRRAERAARAEVEHFGFNQTGPAPDAEAAPTSDAPPSSSDSPSAPLPLVTEVTPAALSTATALCIDAITETLLAGRIGKLDVAKALRSLAVVKQVSISEQAEQRARELHELKLADLRCKLHVAVEAKTAAGTKTLTREDVYDLVDQIMRGAA